MSFAKTLTDKLTNYDSQTSIGSRIRARRIGPLMAMIQAAYQAHGHVQILDVGGTERYWGIVPAAFLEAHQVTITVVNIPGETVPDNRGRFRYIEADGCDLSQFADRAFHIAHSNSVIEHVGNWERMSRFASELSRVSERYFVQTPNFWFLVEPHFMAPFFHWLPEPTRVWLVRHFQLGQWKRADSFDEAVHIVESARLLSRRMFKTLFKDGVVRTERLLGLPKSLIAIKNPAPH
jgi:Methyltransferase domain